MPVLERGVYVASHVELAADALSADDFDAFYERYVVDERRLQAGLAERNMSVDTRLRDALRQVQTSEILAFPAFDVGQEALLADDVMSLADPVERARQRIEGLEQRLGALEQRSWHVLSRG